MPRIERVVFPGLPHHVTQRGNRQTNIFFSDDDRRAYLRWAREYCLNAKVAVVAYCLMSNHVHFVAIPEEEQSFERLFHPLHTRYAQRINRATGWKGHVMQGRPFSSPLDEAHFWAAIRYVERNPVRASMVATAEDYPWSSAAAHCGLRPDPIVSNRDALPADFITTAEWSAWLKGDEDASQLESLRKNSARGLPCGSEEFIESLERRAGIPLKRRPRGRPWPEKNKGARP
jgi:putative transposase